LKWENELTLASVVKEDVTCWRSSSLKKFNLWLKRKIQPEVEASSYKRQASSSKQRLTMVQGSCRMYLERINI